MRIVSRAGVGSTLLLAALLTACAEPGRLAEPPPQKPFPLALPFSPDEMRRALVLVARPEKIEQEIGVLYGPHIGHIVSISDGTLLLLASVSDDAARRVIRYAPHLRAEVSKIRADPAAWRYRVMHANRY